MDFERAAEALAHGQMFAFADWPEVSVPSGGAGLYSIWDGSGFVYVGMAGRGSAAGVVNAKP